MDCFFCQGEVETVTTLILGTYEAEGLKCKDCGEIVYDAEVSMNIMEKMIA